VLAAAARALDLERDPAAAGPAHGRLDVAQPGAQAGEPGDALEPRAARDGDADDPALGVAQAERAPSDREARSKVRQSVRP
jgi:hypothetical protein